MQPYRFFVDSEVDRINLDQFQPESWVEIKRKLSIGDQDNLSQRLFDVEVDTSGSREDRRRRRQSGASAVNAKFRPSLAVLLEISIVEWSFTTESGEKIPVTPEMIQKMIYKDPKHEQKCALCQESCDKYAMKLQCCKQVMCPKCLLDFTTHTAKSGKTMVECPFCRGNLFPWITKWNQ